MFYLSIFYTNKRNVNVNDCMLISSCF